MKRSLSILLAIASLCVPLLSAAEAPPAALAAFDAYAHTVEQRLNQQHGNHETIIANSAPGSAAEAQIKTGLRLIEEVHPSLNIPGALLHHWRGTAFVPGATPSKFARLLTDETGYTTVYAPQILRATSANDRAGHRDVTMRIAQKHIITVVLDTIYDTEIHGTKTRGWQTSRSLRVDEIDSPNTPSEHVLAASEEHGFLWKQNTYWTWEQRPGGLVIQIESISLSRSIPTGLGWIVKPFVQSVPRESLEFTLRATSAALRK